MRQQEPKYLASALDFACFDRKFFWFTLGQGLAFWLHRTGLAIGFARQTNGGAQIHQRLRISRHGCFKLACGQRFFSHLPQSFFVLTDRQIGVKGPHACQYPFDIAIHDGHALRKTKRSHGSGSRSANARQRDQLGCSGRKLAIKPGHHVLGTLMQIARATVVAQTTPQAHDLVLGCCCQFGHSGKVLQELLVVGQYGAHLCLLQHDFRQPHAVRILGVLPRQMVAAMKLLPSHHGLSKGARLFQCF